jgi:hypothetical protein
MTPERILGVFWGAGGRQSSRGPASGRAHSPWTPVVLTAAILVAAACTAGPVAPTSSPASPTPLPAVDAAGFAAAACTANSEMGLSWGNPDTGEKSVAWKAFESAVQAKDPAQIDKAAAPVLLHLDAARAANDRGATWVPGAAASAELTVVLGGLEKYIVTVREAHGESTVAAQAAKDMEAVWPHLQAYWQMLQTMMLAKAIPMTQLPC